MSLLNRKITLYLIEPPTSSCRTCNSVFSICLGRRRSYGETLLLCVSQTTKIHQLIAGQRRYRIDVLHRFVAERRDVFDDARHLFYNSRFLHIVWFFLVNVFYLFFEVVSVSGANCRACLTKWVIKVRQVLKI